MEKTIYTYEVLVRRFLGRSERRWENSIKTELRETGSVSHIE